MDKLKSLVLLVACLCTSGCLQGFSIFNGNGFTPGQGLGETAEEYLARIAQEDADTNTRSTTTNSNILDVLGR